MDTTSWIQSLSRFQAHVRGYLVRNEVRRARKDFEDVVNEIDGAVTHFKWAVGVISLPYFTDNDSPPFLPFGPDKETLRPAQSDEANVQCSVPSRGEDHCVLAAKINTEKDDSWIVFPSCSPSLAEEMQRPSAVGDTCGFVMENPTGGSDKWIPSDVELNYAQRHKGSQQYCLALGVPRTLEALHLHRNTLSMEHLWIQQAIDSRKKYLSLKESVS